MFTCALQSGSNGNCTYVETPDVRLLFDAGISARQARQRLARHGRDIRDADALIISHNHGDHVRGAGVFHRQFEVPLYITAGSWRASRGELGVVRDVRHFEQGETLYFGDTNVQAVATAHDAAEPVAFVVSRAGKKLGIFTDLGHRFAGIEQWIASLDGLYIESNYDPEMLRRGPYPRWLKQRITGNNGHLSNYEAAELVNDCGDRLKLVVLSHLSEQNNHPDIAMATAEETISRQVTLALAPRTSVSRLFAI